jgi:hypothetical protein
MTIPTDQQETQQTYTRRVIAPLGSALDLEVVPMDAPPIQVKDSVRSEDQKHVDRDAWKAYQAWMRLPEPRPTEFNKMPRFRYIVAPEDADTVRQLLTRAGTHHSINVRIAPTKRHQDGNAIIYFAARARSKRNRDENDYPEPEEG